MNEPVNELDIRGVLDGLLKSSHDELMATPQNELDKFWYFQYNTTKSKAWNLYEFNKMLDLYKSQVRRWEEHTNGSSCVVERVRDTYLMPKIKQFIMDLENHE